MQNNNFGHLSLVILLNATLSGFNFIYHSLITFAFFLAIIVQSSLKESLLVDGILAFKILIFKSGCQVTNAWYLKKFLQKAWHICSPLMVFHFLVDPQHKLDKALIIKIIFWQVYNFVYHVMLFENYHNLSNHRMTL